MPRRQPSLELCFASVRVPSGEDAEVARLRLADVLRGAGIIGATALGPSRSDVHLPAPR